MIIFHRSFIIIIFFATCNQCFSSQLSPRIRLYTLTQLSQVKKLNFIVMAFHSHNEIFSHRLSCMFFFLLLGERGEIAERSQGVRETQISIIQFREIKKPAISTADCRVLHGEKGYSTRDFNSNIDYSSKSRLISRVEQRNANYN